MVVGQEDVLDVGQPDAAQQLALRALAAVDQDAVAAAPHEHAGGRPLHGRHRAGGAEEEDGEVHVAYLRGRRREIIAPVPDPPSENVQLLRRMYGAWDSGDLARDARVPRPGVRVGEPRLRGRAGHPARARRLRARCCENLEATFDRTRTTCWARCVDLGETGCCGTRSSTPAAHSGAADRRPRAAPVDAARRQGPAPAVVPRRRGGAPRADAAGQDAESLDERLRSG